MSRSATWSCGRRALRATEVAAGEIPGLIDEIPLLAVLASRAEGTTVFREVGELRVKESDRLGLIAENLRAVGRSGRGGRGTTFTSRAEERTARAPCGPPAITGWPWPSPCSARCRAPGSGSTTWPARR